MQPKLPSLQLLLPALQPKIVLVALYQSRQLLHTEQLLVGALQKFVDPLLLEYQNCYKVYTGA